jgi:glycyl-tRNA synthetase beta subunit
MTLPWKKRRQTVEQMFARVLTELTFINTRIATMTAATDREAQAINTLTGSVNDLLADHDRLVAALKTAVQEDDTDAVNANIAQLEQLTGRVKAALPAAQSATRDTGAAPADASAQG